MTDINAQERQYLTALAEALLGSAPRDRTHTPREIFDALCFGSADDDRTVGTMAGLGPAETVAVVERLVGRHYLSIGPGNAMVARFAAGTAAYLRCVLGIALPRVL